MNIIWRGTSGRRSFPFGAALLGFILASGPLWAQTHSIPDRLPSDTIFYADWRGKTFASRAQEKNHLLQLVQDPDFAPMRDALLKATQQNAGKDSTAPPLNFTEILSVLENAGTFGVVAYPAVARPEAPSSAAPVVGVFLVYDATGKTALIDKIKAIQRANAKDKPNLTTYDFRGTPVEIRTTPGGTSYTARASKYFLFANQKQLIEDLIVRFSGAEKPASSVTQLPAYKAMQPYMGSDSSLEFFAAPPDLNKLIPPENQDTPGVRFARNLHLEKFHAVGGGVSFAGEAFRFHGAMLGDTSSPSLFDIYGSSVSSFVTLPVVDAGPPFHIFRIDLPATYQLLRSAGMQSLAPQQTAYIATGEAMAQAFLGMSVDDALHLFTGEFATESVYLGDGTTSQLYVATIQKAPDVLRLLRATLGKKIIAEDTAGDATILDLSYPTNDPVSGKPIPQHYYVAVAPQMIFVAPRKAVVRAALERFNAKPGAAPSTVVFSSAELNHLRTLLPEKLSGMSGVDLARFPWDKFFAQIAQQINEDAKASKDVTPQQTEWLKLIKPEAFSRHLHAAISGWWKDSNGIYFDSYLQ